MGTGTDDADDGHTLPAVRDLPRGFGEASWWPFVTAVGAAGIYVAAALFVLGRGEDPLVGRNLGPLAFVAGVGTFLVGVYGWLYHAFVEEFRQREPSDGAARAMRWGMLMFLGSDLGTFGAGFGYYFWIRAGPWPPGELPHLLSSLVLANTVVLVVSSGTLHLAHGAIRDGNRERFLWSLGATLLLGLVFVGGQALEYYEFIVKEGFTIAEGAFASAFFGLTGLHGLHVSLGAVLLGIVFVRGLAGQYSADRHVSVATVSLYWHFVDAVWLFLVVVLYVGAVVQF